MKKLAPSTFRLGRCLAGLLLAGMLAACVEEKLEPPRNPSANSQNISTDEEKSISGVLTGTPAYGKPLSFLVWKAPAHGSVTLDRATGSFTYTPDVDFYGTDQFTFHSVEERLHSSDTSVTVQVNNVNDAPVLAELPAMRNSAYIRETFWALDATDVDSDPLTFEASASDTEVATARVDPQTRMIFIDPRKVGETEITIQVSDAEFTRSQTFLFTVTEVTKDLQLIVPVGNSQALKFTNISDEPTVFSLTHNGWPMFSGPRSYLEFVRSMPDEIPNEPLERKIWRFVRDTTAHDAPVTDETWLYRPWATINSMGWGLCGHVAYDFIAIANAAGYDTRYWGLSGHVVPEIEVNGRWEMYDPDLGVYYRNRDGEVAGVEELADTPELITLPTDALYSDWTYPYTQRIATIYSTGADNSTASFEQTAEKVIQKASVELPNLITLPGQSSFTYPGKWTEPPVGVDGEQEVSVADFKQGLMELAPAWTGTLRLPYVLWEIEGSGELEISGERFEIGSAALRDRVRNTSAPIEEIIVTRNESVRLIMFVNLVKMHLTRQTSAQLTGLRVWTLEPEIITLDNQNGAANQSPKTKVPPDRP